MSVNFRNLHLDQDMLARLSKSYVPIENFHIRENILTGHFRRAGEQEKSIVENNVFMLTKMLPIYLEKHSHIMIGANEQGEICEFYFLQPR